MTGPRFHRTMTWSPPSPGSLQTLLFPPLLNKVESKGTKGVRARYDTEFPPIIPIVRHPSRPVILGVETPKERVVLSGMALGEMDSIKRGKKTMLPVLKRQSNKASFKAQLSPRASVKCRLWSFRPLEKFVFKAFRSMFWSHLEVVYKGIRKCCLRKSTSSERSLRPNGLVFNIFVCLSSLFCLFLFSLPSRKREREKLRRERERKKREGVATSSSLFSGDFEPHAVSGTASQPPSLTIFGIASGNFPARSKLGLSSSP